MRGDFSSWRNEHQQNFVGVLHQQGRVLLDADWNAQTELTNDWQDTAGMDIIGAGVAAIPSDQPDGFLITAAELKTLPDRVELTVKPGRVWADGLLYRLNGPATGVKRTARYLQPPIQDPAAGFPTIPSSPVTRDAVILEVWREELSAFQLPELLFEPALGDPDTTERVLTSAAFRLFRLAEGETCNSIAGRLKDDFSNKGKLIVELQPTASSGTPDCPLVAGGGYTGFEHNLYRIEIADVDAATPMFKWSQYNGGIVGRGKFDSAVNPKTVTIHANLQAIINSGITSCYLEALEFDPSPIGDLGHWRVSYGAEATIGADGIITLSNTTMFGVVPTSNADVFFRIWNGIEEISDFSGSLVPLQDGILLNFDPVASGKYTPRDYWTFPVRAGEIANNPLLVNHQPPQGIHYHRVPLAELNWTANPIPSVDIEDCRQIFDPLTRVATCCTYRVGDGVQSHGDFTSIQVAVDHLPASGGEICVLPGNYQENVKIFNRRNITIKGCGRRSRVISAPRGNNLEAAPVFHIVGSQNIKIQSLKIQADDVGIGVLIEEAPLVILIGRQLGSRQTIDVTLEHLLILAATRSAIRVDRAYVVTIRRCRIEMNDVRSTRPGIFFIGQDSLIEENEIVVEDPKQRADETDPNRPLDPDNTLPAHAALGGLQLGGKCERIRVINNVISRGVGNGITLGSLRGVDQNGNPVPEEPETDPDPCTPCLPGDVVVPTNEEGGTDIESDGELHQILIERNRIFNMGLNGIGVVGFFDLRGTTGLSNSAISLLVTVEQLYILGNTIRLCLQRTVAEIPSKFQNLVGYGGISLAFVEELFIRDNFIQDNGPDYLQPVCGIFVVHGEGIEISRNLIINNGQQTEEPPTGAKRGPRGGIFITACIGSTVPVPRIPKLNAVWSSGVPALKVQENIVSAPLGRALTAMALGPVSVVGNQFTSQEIEPANLKIANVLILNLGRAIDDERALKRFEGLKTGHEVAITRSKASPAATRPNEPATGAIFAQAVANSPSQFLNGSVLFTNNQCISEGVGRRGFTGVANLPQLDFGAAIAILSLDDIGFHANQSECIFALSGLTTNVALISIMSLRASDNRLKEALPSVAFSGITLGRLNMTTDNQATHCLLIAGPAATRVNTPNTILEPGGCLDITKLFEGVFN